MHPSRPHHNSLYSLLNGSLDIPWYLDDFTVVLRSKPPAHGRLRLFTGAPSTIPSGVTVKGDGDAGKWKDCKLVLDDRGVMMVFQKVPWSMLQASRIKMVQLLSIEPPFKNVSSSSKSGEEEV